MTDSTHEVHTRWYCPGIVDAACTSSHMLGSLFTCGQWLQVVLTQRRFMGVCSGLSAAVCLSGHAGVSSSPDPCTECPVGFYSGGGPKGSTLCQPCVNGTSTPGPGSASPDNCTGAAHTTCAPMQSAAHHLILNCTYSDEAASVASTRAASHRKRSSACHLCSNTRSPDRLPKH